MDFSAGTVEVGAEAVAVCNVPMSGILVKNLGGSVVYLGGPGVGGQQDGETAGFPLEPGTVQTIPGLASQPKESPIVPAPADDPSMAALALYARSGAESISKVSWLRIG